MRKSWLESSDQQPSGAARTHQSWDGASRPLNEEVDISA
jgi:hypothetical protein